VKKGSGGGKKKEVRREIRIRADQTIGEVLLAAREASGLTLEQVSQETKIPRESLEYLETDNFEAIPAKVYVKGFLRSYAELLGLDVAHLMSKYEVQTGLTHTSKGDHWEIETEVVEEKLQSPRIMKRYVLPAILVIAAVVVIVRLGMRGRPDAEPPSQKSVLEEVGGGGDAPQPVPVDSLEEEHPRSEERAGETAEAAGRPEPPQADRSAGPPPGESVPEERPPRVAEPEVDQTPLQLELIALENERTWFDIMTVSTVDERPETTAYDFILFPGESRVLDATDAFILQRVGNAGGFTMKLNGAVLPPLGEPAEVIYGVVITREDLPRE
jgi:cytoskeleton protein RodZ